MDQEHGQASVENNRRALERERRMAVTIMIILVFFFLTYLPQYITIHLAYFCDSCEISEDSITFHKIDVVASRFLFLNSALNPFIYAWRMPKYRRALDACLKIVKNKLCVFKRPRVDVYKTKANADCKGQHNQTGCHTMEVYQANASAN